MKTTATGYLWLAILVQSAGLAQPAAQATVKAGSSDAERIDLLTFAQGTVSSRALNRRVEISCES